MDQPDLSEREHVQALRGLERLNFWSGSASILWPAVRAELQQAGTPLRLLDVATGGADVPLRLWHKAQKAGLPLEVEGCDVSATALKRAQEQAERLGAPARFHHLDVLNDPIPEPYDIVTTSLFLHHLEEADAVEVLRRMSQATRRLLLVSDLRRGLPGWLLAYLASRLFSASRIVHTDGPLSVEGAFLTTELSELASRAGLAPVRVDRRWPFRMLLTWRRPT
jgi:2-polyprenyl-3-methyl-5-hydroxy-6-metoxy-1,4-benzoquinol methylase